MAARDRWSRDLKCPQCGSVGKVDFSEDDHPYMKSGSLEADVSGSFKLQSIGPTSTTTKFACLKCGIVI